MAEEVKFKTSDHPLSNNINGIWKFLSHFSYSHDVHEHLYLEASSEDPGDINLSKRLILSYKAMRNHESIFLKAEERPNGGIWEMVKNHFHTDFLRLIDEDDPSAFANYMRNAMREQITYGLGPCHTVFDAFSKEGEGRNVNIQLQKDRLTSLAEAVGALPYENPEQGRYGINATLSATDLVDRIEHALGVSITRPSIMGSFGLLVNDGIVDVRVPEDAYTIYRAKMLSEIFKLKRVCEIGGGLGGTALQAKRMGFERYTIVDIPVISLVQAWFLIKALGKQSVQLFAEDIPGHFVHLVPYWNFSEVDFDLMINRDSLPEIQVEHATHYIRGIADRKSVLLSINQESQNSASQNRKQLWVNELIKAEPRMRLLSRNKFWLREGYIEEVYVPTSP